jgi:hypothetical protein
VHLRKLGIRSFLYIGKELAGEQEFFKMTGHPQCHVSAPPDDATYDTWVRDTFHVAGAKKRFIKKLKELQ